MHLLHRNEPHRKCTIWAVFRNIIISYSNKVVTALPIYILSIRENIVKTANDIFESCHRVTAMIPVKKVSTYMN